MEVDPDVQQQIDEALSIIRTGHDVERQVLAIQGLSGFGRCRDVQLALYEVLAGPPGSPLIDEAKRVLQGAVPTVSPDEELAALLASPQAHVRRAALECLTRWRDTVSQFIPVLFDFLRDPDPDVQQLCVHLLLRPIHPDSYRGCAPAVLADLEPGADVRQFPLRDRLLGLRFLSNYLLQRCADLIQDRELWPGERLFLDHLMLQTIRRAADCVTLPGELHPFAALRDWPDPTNHPQEDPPT
jgi:hypothetical protein